MLGVEQEFDLFLGQRPLDFRALFPSAIQHSRSVSFRNCEDAAILEAGYVLACDGREAEFATAPIDYLNDGPLALAREVARCRRHMLGVLHRAGVTSVRGYSTHLSITVPRGQEREIAEAFAVTIGPALILLTEARNSPGLLLRTRRGRLEIGTEYIDSRGQLAAALVLMAGAVHAYLFNQGLWPEFPRVKLKRWEEANIRPGIYLPRDAYGEPIHQMGRAARLELDGGGAITAGELLGRCASLVEWELQGLVDGRALDALKRGVAKHGALHVESKTDPSRLGWIRPSSPISTARTLQMLARASSTGLTPCFIDWEGAAFTWQRTGHTLILGVPWTELPALFSAARQNQISSLIPEAQRPEPLLNSLDQLDAPRSFHQIDAAALSSQALSDKAHGPKAGRAKKPAALRPFESEVAVMGAPRPVTVRSSRPRSHVGLAIGVMSLVVISIVIIGVLVLAVGGSSHGTTALSRAPTTPSPTGFSQAAQALAQATDTVAAAAACVPAPSLAYPPDGALRSGDALVRWAPTGPLGPGQRFAVLAAANPTELQGVNAPADVVGTTTDSSLPLDFTHWRYAGKVGRFFWTVRIQDAAGVFVDCGGTEPISFTVVHGFAPTALPKGTKPAPTSNSGPPPTPTLLP